MAERVNTLQIVRVHIERTHEFVIVVVNEFVPLTCTARERCTVSDTSTRVLTTVTQMLLCTCCGRTALGRSIAHWYSKR